MVSNSVMNTRAKFCKEGAKLEASLKASADTLRESATEIGRLKHLANLEALRKHLLRCETCFMAGDVAPQLDKRKLG